MYLQPVNNWLLNRLCPGRVLITHTVEHIQHMSMAHIGGTTSTQFAIKTHTESEIIGCWETVLCLLVPVIIVVFCWVSVCWFLIFVVLRLTGLPINLLSTEGRKLVRDKKWVRHLRGQAFLFLCWVSRHYPIAPLLSPSHTFSLAKEVCTEGRE